MSSLADKGQTNSRPGIRCFAWKEHPFSWRVARAGAFAAAHFRTTSCLGSLPCDSDQPHFRHVTATAVVAQARLAKPTQRQLSLLRRFRRDGKFPGFRRVSFRDERMDRDLFVRGQTNPAAWYVARINDAEFVARGGIETGIAQPERLVIERRCGVPPGETPAFVSKIDQRRPQKRRIFF